MKLIKRGVYLYEIESWNYIQRLANLLADFYLTEIDSTLIIKSPLDFALRDLLWVLFHFPLALFLSFTVMPIWIPISAIRNDKPCGFSINDENKNSFIRDVWVLDLTP